MNQTEQLLAQLGALYQGYQEKSLQLEQEKGGYMRRVRWAHWKKPAGTQQARQTEEEFYHGVERVLAELTAALDDLTEEAREDAARTALGWMLTEKPPVERRSSRDWMAVAAEPLCAPLMKYLSREQVREVYDAYCRRYPRGRLPGQQKLAEAMEAQLKAADIPTV